MIHATASVQSSIGGHAVAWATARHVGSTSVTGNCTANQVVFGVGCHDGTAIGKSALAPSPVRAAGCI